MEKLNKLLNEHSNIDKSRNSLSNLLKKVKLDNEIFTFLSKLGFETLKQNYYHYINNDMKKPSCIICNSEVNWVEKDFKYRETCSSKCSGKLNLTRKKLKVVHPKIADNNNFIKYFSTGKIKLIRESLYKIYPDLVLNVDKLTIECDSYSEKVYCYLNNIESKPVCAHCSYNKVSFDSFTKGYHRYCSIKCSSNSIDKKSTIEKTCIEKYGVKNIGEVTRDKSMDTMIKKYGCHISKTDNYREKIKKLSIDKYGVEHPFKSDIIRSLIKDTCYKKYGFDSPMKNSYIKEKSLKTGIKNGHYHKWSKKELKSIENYRSAVSYYTERTYKEYMSVINPNNIERGLFSNHLDHIYPVIEGWKNKIDPKLISNYKNLQLISSYDNLSKSDRTKMSLDDFFNLINLSKMN